VLVEDPDSWNADAVIERLMESEDEDFKEEESEEEEEEERQWGQEEEDREGEGEGEGEEKEQSRRDLQRAARIRRFDTASSGRSGRSGRSGGSYRAEIWRSEGCESNGSNKGLLPGLRRGSRKRRPVLHGSDSDLVDPDTDTGDEVDDGDTAGSGSRLLKRKEERSRVASGASIISEAGGERKVILGSGA